MTVELPISSVIAAACALMLIVLSARVGLRRFQTRISLLDGGDTELRRRMRAQANFVEYVPLAVLLLALAELQGAPAGLLWGLGGGLVGALLGYSGCRLWNRQVGTDGSRLLGAWALAAFAYGGLYFTWNLWPF